jgi:hypothetical protein
MDLTRRGLLGRAVAASGALLGGSLLGPSVSFAGEDGEAVFEVAAPRGSQPVELQRTFELIGVRGAGDARVEVRARGLDGRWSEWLPVHPAHDHGPDRRRAGGDAGPDDGGSGALSDPVWTGPARAFALRSNRSLRGARVVLVDSGRPAAAAASSRYVETGLRAGPGQPKVIARSAWATRACRPRVPAVFGAVDLTFVHHTVSSNAYRASQSAAMVRAICLFHKYGNGWNDIGYNFVVDRYGQIFEGRAGGIDEAIVGAQAGGYNVYSSGVALLGSFSAGGPPRRAFDALSKLLAWKLALHGIDLPGEVTVEVTSTGGPYSRYRPGTRVTLNRIAGHRDADTTSCPGAGMYRQLPRLRQVVQRLAGTPCALDLQTQAAAPGVLTLAGSLAKAGQAIAGATIEIQSRSTTRGATLLGTAATDASGAWSATVPLAAKAELRAVYRGDAAHPAVVSPGVVATVPPQIALSAASQQGVPGVVIEFTGTVTPAKKRVTIAIAQLQPDGTFATIRTITLKPDKSGSFTRAIGFAAAGQYQVVAQSAADAANAAGASPVVPVTIA